MKRQIGLILAFLLIAHPTLAQINITVPMTTAPYGERYRPTIAPIEPEAATALLRYYPFVDERPQVRTLAGWEPFSVSHAISGVLFFSLAKDLESTFNALQYPGVREGNPLMRPFVNAGQPVSIAAATGLTMLGLQHAKRLRQDKRPFVRVLGWVTPVASAWLHFWAADHNNAIAERKRARYGY